MSEIVTLVPQFISCIGNVVTALFTSGTTPGALNPLLEYFLIGVTASIILFSFVSIKKVVWGA